MIKCSNCAYESADGSKFCENCGSLLSADTFCPNCGTKILSDDAFCANCGFAVKQAAAAEAAAPIESAAPAETVNLTNDTVPVNSFVPANGTEIVLPKPKSKKLFLKIGLPIISVVLVAAIVLSCLLIFGKKSGINYALYIKDDQLFISSIKKSKPWEVTSNLFDDDERYLPTSLYPQCTDDGKMIFFIDNIKTERDEEYDYDEIVDYDLYYRYTNDPKKEAVKIDSNIENFLVSLNGDCVTYIKKGSLYQHDLKNKEKIDGKDGDVTGFIATDDGKLVIYSTETDDDDSEYEYDFYFKQKGKKEEKIDSNISEICSFSSDLKTVYYEKDDALYKKTLGKEKQKISSDIEKIITVYQTGEAYYLKAAEKATLADFINDDMASADKNAQMPTPPDYPTLPTEPSYTDYEQYVENYGYYGTDWDAYYEAHDEWENTCAEIRDEYDAKYADYQDELEKYEQIDERNEFREMLKENDELEDPLLYTLYYYDGKKEHTLAENNALLFTEVSGDTPTLIFKTCDDIESAKIDMSDINDYDDIYYAAEQISDKLREETKYMLASKDKISSIDADDIDSFYFTSDGKTVYFLQNEDEDRDSDEIKTYDLYKMSISGGKAAKPKFYDDDVAYCTLLSNDKIAYAKDVDKKDRSGDIFIEKEMIDSDVYTNGMITEIPNTGTGYYFTDYDDEEQSGTLKYFNGKKSETVADDVYTFSHTPNGDLIYLCDYDQDDEEGDLYAYRKGKSIQIDDDVSEIITILSTKQIYDLLSNYNSLR